MTGLYIHIPFCATRCIYCGFYSSTHNDLQDKYVQALCREMSIRPSTTPLSTIYLGGGTPSQLSRDNLHALFTYIYKVYDCKAEEITMECNPDDITEDFCKTLQELPINRISMGIQSFANDRLHFLRRRHTSQQAILAVERLRQAGISNISIDLMFGFPNETIEEWQHDIDAALSLNVEHISAYSLQYEEGTPLYRMMEQGKVKPIDDELYRSMYNLLCDKLEKAGYEHYEISNFAMPCMRSLHNSSYWHDIEYIGLGASAHSYDKNTRSWNVSNINQYISSIMDGKRPCETEHIDNDTHYDDTVMTTLRTREGIAIDNLDEHYRKYILHEADRYMKQGMLQLTGDKLRLTREGIFISDMIMSDLMIK